MASTGTTASECSAGPLTPIKVLTAQRAVPELDGTSSPLFSQATLLIKAYVCMYVSMSMSPIGPPNQALTVTLVSGEDVFIGIYKL